MGLRPQLTMQCRAAAADGPRSRHHNDGADPLAYYVACPGSSILLAGLDSVVNPYVCAIMRV